jgi:hypothetical protein
MTETEGFNLTYPLRPVTFNVSLVTYKGTRYCKVRVIQATLPPMYFRELFSVL